MGRRAEYTPLGYKEQAEVKSFGENYFPITILAPEKSARSLLLERTCITYVLLPE